MVRSTCTCTSEGLIMFNVLQIEHYQSLEEQLEKTLSELEVQRQRLKSRELELNIAQKKLKDDRK